MTLKKKILFGYGVAFALMGLVVVWAAINLASVGKSTNIIVKDNYRSILAAVNMIDALEKQDSGILLMLLDDKQKGIELFRKNEAEFLKWLARAKDNITIEKETQLIQKIEDDYNSYRQLFSKLTDFPKQAKNEEVRQSSLNSYREEIHPLLGIIRQNCTELKDLNEKRMYMAGKSSQNVSQRAVWLAILVTVVILIGVAGFSLLNIERIFRPIKKLETAALKVASGKYTIRMPVKSADELGRLTDAFNRMIGQFEMVYKNNTNRIHFEKNKGKAILTCSEDGLVVFDTELRATDVNPVAQRMLFLTVDEKIPLHCSEIFKSTSICKVISNIMESGHQLNVPDEQRIVTLSKNDQSRRYLYSTTAIYKEDDKLSGIVLLLRDITRLKELERLKNEFILAASHELRTPLTSLGMSIESLRKYVNENLSDREKELLQAAHEEVNRMKALVNDLLDLSKIESGRIAIEFESVPIKTLFRYIQKVFKSQLERKSVTLSGELGEELPNIRADANKITWVLSNLISNALRYVNNGGHIQFIANRVGPQVHLSVRDDGPGIPLDYQSKIFQKYVQVKGQESGGAGLGLAICKEIVRAHGGGIWVESLPGQGSTFTVTIPIAH